MFMSKCLFCAQYVHVEPGVRMQSCWNCDERANFSDRKTLEHRAALAVGRFLMQPRTQRVFLVALPIVLFLLIAYFTHQRRAEARLRIEHARHSQGSLKNVLRKMGSMDDS